MSTNPALDLGFERIVDVSPHAMWRAWTEPELLKQWFCPLPWTTVDAELDVRPGGIFRTTMQSPEGQQFPNMGCFLELIPHRKIVWTNALQPGYRPAPANTPCGDEAAEFMFTATVEFIPHGEQGTRYVAHVSHADEAGCRQHATMGFEAGWGAALNQLVALMKKQP